MKCDKRVLIGCVATISIVVVLILSLHNPDDTSISRDKLLEMSPATRIEYQTNGSITSCVTWSNLVLCAVFSDKAMAERNLKKTSMDIDTSQWVIRVTFHIDEVSVNIPEIVYMVGNGWISIDGSVYDFPSNEESQQFLTRLTGYFYSELALNGEEMRKNDPE